MVNGGGAVTLEFHREPFVTYKKTFRVPWNEIILIDPIELVLDAPQKVTSASKQQAERDIEQQPSCLAHSYSYMVPHIIAHPKSTWKRSSSSSSSLKSRVSMKSLGYAGAHQTSKSVILRDSGLVQHSLPLPGGSFNNPTTTTTSTSTPSDYSDSSFMNETVSLVYISSRSNEFMSTINLQLIPPSSENFKLPDELKLVHLKIVVEGNLFEQVFEPIYNLNFTYAWNRLNVYRQKCFGLSNAIVSVGYEYYDCKHVIWSRKQIELPGYDLSISDIGQWNLNIHHRYNYRDSILHRGDGQNFYLKTGKPKIVNPLIGDGYQRQSLCPFCDGATVSSEQRLLKPQALVSAPDGSIYVGDYNLIRRVEFGSGSPGSTQNNKNSNMLFNQEKLVRTVLEIPHNQVPSRYNLAINFADSNKLYMSDPDRYLIYQIKDQLTSGKSLTELQLDETNRTTSKVWADQLVPVVGSGIKCQLNDGSNCGDGQLASLARLVEPKSITFDLTGRMYIADGHNIRLVDLDQRIYTLLGDYGQQSSHKKYPCSSEPIPMHKFVPKWPQDIAINPVDETLHILDDNVVYRVTQDKRVQIVAGRLNHCYDGKVSINQKPPLATDIFIQSAQSISFNQNGDLFISEEDQKKSIARVLMVSAFDGSIRLHAGMPVIDQTNIKVMQKPSIDSYEHQLMSDLSNDEQQYLQRPSNSLPSPMTGSPALTKANEYRFNSIAAICVDQQGRLIIADRLQLRLLSVEPDLPQTNAAGEYELQSPDSPDEYLIFNKFGHHIATRELNGGPLARNNKYTFSYSVNTAFGQLASIQYASGNRVSIFRDGPHHIVKMIETSFGGQTKMDISQTGQVHSITIVSPNPTKANFSYYVDRGLLKQSRDQASGEIFDYYYDEFGRAIGIQETSPSLPGPIECRIPSTSSGHLSNGYQAYQMMSDQPQIKPTIPSNSSPLCSSLVVAE